MSSFNCEYCGKPIIDAPGGYITACKHYPNKRMNRGQQMRHQEWLKTLKTIEERVAPIETPKGEKG